MEYLVGERERPAWVIGDADFHGDSQSIDRTVTWIHADAPTKEAVLAAMRDGRMDPTGEGLTKAGKICGIVGVVLNLIAIGFYIVFFVILAAAVAGGAVGGAAGGAGP